jgi:hypothetical protein
LMVTRFNAFWLVAALHHEFVGSKAAAGRELVECTVHVVLAAVDADDIGPDATGWTMAVAAGSAAIEQVSAAGIEAARAENGGRCPWGGRKAGTRVKVTEEVETAIHEMARAGKSIAEIARVLKVSRPTVYATLNRAKVPA